MVIETILEMHYSLALLSICAVGAIWKRNRKRAAIFATALMGAMTVTIINPSYTDVKFFAIYAIAAGLVFFLLDWKAGALLGLISIPGSLLAFGLISQLDRDIFGEIAFVLAVPAGFFFGPSGGIANRIVGLGRSRGDSFDIGRAHDAQSNSSVAGSSVKVEN